MEEKHAWDRLVTLSGDALQDYRAIQPYLQQVMSGTGKEIGTTRLGSLWQFVSTINGQEVWVKAIRLADGTLQMVDAWVKAQ